MNTTLTDSRQSAAGRPPAHGSREAWLQAHPYLRPMESIEQALDDAARVLLAAARALGCEAQSHRHDGVPLLSRAPAGTYAAAADLLDLLVARLARSEALPARLRDACHDLDAAFRRSAAEPRRAVAWLLGGDEAPSHPELLYTLGWMAMSRAVASAAQDPAHGNDDPWDRPYCPTCGAPPSMAQLVTSGEGRRRLLVCGRCRTRWGYQRFGCPFCGNERQEDLRVLQVEGDDALRLDTCEACLGYLKTYAGEGEESLFLLGWTTLHLDVLARERGYENTGASLFEI